MNRPNIDGGSFPAATSVLPVSPGGTLANASHDATHARSTVADEQLREGPAGVVADEGDVVQIKPVEELGDQPRYPGQ